MPTTTTGVATEFINFSRASNATVTDSNGRIDWARHNLLLASEQFDNSNWQKTNASVSANQIVAPDGTTTADKLVETAAAGIHNVYQNITTSAANYSFSVFLKKAERTFSLVYHNISNAGVSVNLNTGATSIPAGFSAPSSYSVTSIGNGWYQCVITVTATAASNSFLCYTMTDASTYSYTGDGTSGIYLWGAHLYRSDMGMQANTSAYPMYNPTTPKNLLGFTENFENAAWLKQGILAFGSGSVANGSIAPNGLQTADLIVPTTVNASHSVNQTLTLTSTTVAFSVYAKAGGYNYAAVQINDAVSNGAGTSFDLSNGTIVGDVTIGTWTVASKSITSVGNGWYRISVVINATGTTRKCECEARSTNSTTWAGPYTGDGTSGIYLWGAQLSDSASLDPYVANHFAAPSAAAYYGPRLDYDPVTLAAKGLLVEEQRTNLITNSVLPNNGITPTGWSRVLGSNGAASASTLTGASTGAYTFTATADRQIIVQSSSLAANTTYIFSVYVESTTGVGQQEIITIANPPAGSTVTNAPSSGSTNGQRITTTIAVGATAGTADLRLGIGCLSNATGTVRISAPQIEAGSFATSYIPVGATTAGATRSADVAQVGTAAFPYSDTEGTLVVATQYAGVGTGYQYSTGLSTGSGVSNIASLTSNSGVMGARVRSGGSDCLDANLVSAAVGGIRKVAIALKANDFAAVLNGGSPVTSITGAMPVGIVTLNSPAIGSQWIRQITYIPRRLTNADLQARTSA